MCGKAPSPPAPVAPPAPIPKADATLEARDNKQKAAVAGATSGYQATMLTEGNLGQASTSSPVLGG